MQGVEERLKSLSITRRVQPPDPAYLLDVTLQPGAAGSSPGGVLAVACSDHRLRLYNRETLRLLGECRGHTAPVCGVTFAHASPDVLYSGSADGTVRAWDVRRPGSAAVRELRGDPAHRFCSLDVSAADVVVCAGTEQLDEDSFLVFWDARAAAKGPLGVYSESHSDDVTQVRFHPRDKDRLATGAMDGLVNVFDLRRGGEDDALLATCNSGSSAAAVCWAGPALDRLLCLTHGEGLHLWDLGRLDSEEPLTLYSAADARQLTPLEGGGSVDYLVGGQWLEEAQRLLVVGGGGGGDLHLMECTGAGLELLRSLPGAGHTAVVRCFLWDEAAEGALVTGGEDAQLLLWKPGGEELAPGRQAATMKSSSAMKMNARPHQQHGSGLVRPGPAWSSPVQPGPVSAALLPPRHSEPRVSRRQGWVLDSRVSLILHGEEEVEEEEVEEQEEEQEEEVEEQEEEQEEKVDEQEEVEQVEVEEQEQVVEQEEKQEEEVEEEVEQEDSSSTLLLLLLLSAPGPWPWSLVPVPGPGPPSGSRARLGGFSSEVFAPSGRLKVPAAGSHKKGGGEGHVRDAAPLPSKVRSVSFLKTPSPSERGPTLEVEGFPAERWCGVVSSPGVPSGVQVESFSFSSSSCRGRRQPGFWSAS
ncbi:unnamed protein product [Merluccius merluccius]